MAILEVKGLHKSFGALEVLKGVDLSMEKGRCSPSSVQAAAAKLRFCAA